MAISETTSRHRNCLEDVYLIQQHERLPSQATEAVTPFVFSALLFQYHSFPLLSYAFQWRRNSLRVRIPTCVHVYRQYFNIME